jgi:hypothetical protein
MDSRNLDDHYNKSDVLADPWLDRRPALALTEPELDDLMAYPASLRSPQYRNLVNANIRGGSLYPN